LASVDGRERRIISAVLDPKAHCGEKDAVYGSGNFIVARPFCQVSQFCILD